MMFSDDDFKLIYGCAINVVFWFVSVMFSLGNHHIPIIIMLSSVSLFYIITYVFALKYDNFDEDWTFPQRIAIVFIITVGLTVFMPFAWRAMVLDYNERIVKDIIE